MSDHKADASVRYAKRARKVIPLGTQVFSKGYNYFVEGVSPSLIAKGKGSHVWDWDGNEYIDFICGLGPVTLGYCDPDVDDAIREQLKNGISFSLPHPLESTVAEKLVEIIPCAEMVRFFKTGSEACQAAVRVARAYTGRDRIIFRGYHGWHEWYAIGSERPKGIPKEYGEFIHQFNYNDIKSLQTIFDAFYGQIAAVIMEPTISTRPDPGFLEEIRYECDQNGALLIFDEVVTGFRMALGGAQEYFGVTPDLATFGKGMANGMPLNAVVGRRDIMKEFEEVFASSTFGGETLSLAAALATINKMEFGHTIDHCWEMGKRLMKGLEWMGIQVGGFPCRPIFTLPVDSPEVKTLFMQECVKRGILSHSGAMNICYSHTEEDIDKALEVIAESFDIVEKAIGNETVAELLEGTVIQPSFKRL